MLSLSIADQYHLTIQVDIPPELSRVQLQAYFFFPAKLADNSDVMNKSSFYHNLLQQQQLVKVEPISCHTIDRDLLIIKQTAYASAQANQSRYVLALSEFVSGIVDLQENASLAQLAYIGDQIEQFSRIHDNEQLLTQGQLFKLALHLLMYHYHQSLLQAKHQASKEDKLWLTVQIQRLCVDADILKIKLSPTSEAGREKLLNRLHIAKRVIHRPHQLTRKKLKDGEVAEQLIFGFAAALAMAFATGIAFATQKAFGNFSTPFFFSLVLSYIFKDRIKELGRNYLMEKYFSKYSQHHYRFYQHGSSQLVYDAKEAVYRQKPAELPEKVNALRKRFYRAESHSFKEALVYKRSYTSHTHSQPNSQFKFKDKLTVNLSKRLRLLPRMVRSHWEETESNIKLHNVHSVYPINIVLVTKTDSGCSYYRYKLTTSRKGIHRLEQVE
ncbi:hypothetical protein Q4601_11100 [Shewanella sp. 1_MG-2023]|uniref:Uncharacterized protein n=1 Tax=Shewanella electrodiphila TaxID=934143 RepID=A0ABT0KUD9_9GAMM|nr:MULTISPECIES: hypothetical protein [Shewanella]MCL1047186.1 hypothetical protein [Shewanella electrodiphila]MDO6612729.1 hypothetical protein [Shewanella sp. 7_MG-2023]MDO6772690.1 hypothetical protein [Shewanella sp. 2_MG-2023]MDO6794854.1 hypothetical protein [Shewanella sp. 1_MG-2023]PMG77559.1 hypothetical protein BCU84_09995 [Shewanella sp. 10N.286.51.B7]